MLPFGVPGQLGFDEQRLEGVNRLVARLVEDGCFPGAVLLVARRGHVVLYKSYGFSQLLPEKRPMTLDTVFDLASLTKVVATLPVALRLVEKGELSLDDPVSTYLPDFRGWSKDNVRVWHLLTHTSGLPAHLPLYSLLPDKKEVFNYISLLNLEYEPGTRVVYSDLGFILLGRIIEVASGGGLDEVARELVFKPLGMDETTFNPVDELKERAAATEYCKIRGRILRGEVHDENSWFLGGVAGHAGLFSTAADLAVYAQTWLNKGVFNGVKVLSPLTVKLAVRNQTGGLNECRGLGWVLNRRPCSCGDFMSEKAYGHTGFTGTSIWIDPLYELFVVLLTNRVHPTRENQCIQRARRLIHNAILSSLVNV
ncbi:MAG: serine hydrolase [Thermofilaceae archaeon]|nr:serine hydrolase [Thermofilaceae archaeon]MCX8179837.1 serine hydrolase [Thermofilaceae archaeon]MDW8004363.1 serine hydrolase [Thermofilaceae archaeon]